MSDIGAVGFGLNQQQQAAMADLWRWHKESCHANIVIGGPPEKAKGASDE